MKFFRRGRIIELKDGTKSTLHLITPPQLRCLVQKDGANVFFRIQIISIALHLTQTNSTQLIPKMQTFTTKFASLFQTP